MTRVCLRLSYDGSRFSGFAENVGVRTIAGELRSRLERVYGQPIRLTCSGRTDAGVHARDQYVHFDVEGSLVEPDRLRRSLNSFLAPQVVTHEVRLVGDDFDARRSARWRQYRYSILNTELSDPFLAATSWWVHEPLDLDAMTRATQRFLGTHDFSAFCRRPKAKPDVSLARRVVAAEWSTRPALSGGPDLLQLDVIATAFCHQMVRSVVGFLVDLGRGKFAVEKVDEIIASGDRSMAGDLAPPQGLCLWKVGFEPLSELVTDVHL